MAKLRPILTGDLADEVDDDDPIAQMIVEEMEVAYESVESASDASSCSWVSGSSSENGEWDSEGD